MGGADTSTPDPTSTCSTVDGYISYGFNWQDGVPHSGRAPGINSSLLWVSNNGRAVGISENGIDPLTGVSSTWEPFSGGRTVPSPIWGRLGETRHRDRRQ